MVSKIKEECFSEEYLYGDIFSQDDIEQWYKEEEGYANLYGVNNSSEGFQYTNFDVLFGYKYLPKGGGKNVMGLGASWGFEFLPIIEKIEKLTIIDSSEQTVSTKLGDIVPLYIKAQSSGRIDIPDNSCDLITAFSVLHHIPNVTFVISELIRVLQKDGYLLIREPINSMELFSEKRMGLTKNGINKE